MKARPKRNVGPWTSKQRTPYTGLTRPFLPKEPDSFFIVTPLFLWQLPVPRCCLALTVCKATLTICYSNCYVHISQQVGWAPVLIDWLNLTRLYLQHALICACWFASMAMIVLGKVLQLFSYLCIPSDGTPRLDSVSCSYLWKVLSDPNRRRQYDLSGGDEEAKSADYQPVDMEGIGSMGWVWVAYVYIYIYRFYPSWMLPVTSVFLFCSVIKMTVSLTGLFCTYVVRWCFPGSLY